MAPGVTRLQRAGVNCYLVESPDGVILIDGGLPGMWSLLERALRALDAGPGDVQAVLLTHGHFDHVGMCERLFSEYRRRSHVHELDRELARHPYRYRRESSPLRYPFRYPKALLTLGPMTAAGALWVEGVKARTDVRNGEPMDVPGAPVPIWTPGHTDGHCAFHLPDRGVVFTGDALVTLDPYTGRTGPRLVARAATADVEANLLSLRKIADTDAALVLPGHGLPYAAGARSAVAEALRAGAA
ncbi:MBL fold metallo-hydrolase [Microbacterium flavescens]|uniref:MBL fold metallo-hydrolase n=1 Tax=Microbacterium flavescens TaxID=69366 RepID=UPI0027DDC613|nr:MBL fold metallo-hydrolase [Microbacterium flavescens]